MFRLEMVVQTPFCGWHEVIFYTFVSHTKMDIFIVPFESTFHMVGFIAFYHIFDHQTYPFGLALLRSRKLLFQLWLCFIQAIWRSTKVSTLGESLTDAQGASFPASDLMNWKLTWLGSIQEKSLHECNQCNYTCTSSGTLQRHMIIHTGEKPFKCAGCEYSSIGTDELKAHMIGKHTGEKPHKCNQCNYTCIPSGTLQRHMMIHTGEKPFKCNKYNKANIQTKEISQNISEFKRLRSGW